jgi:hypothetical protein
MAEAVAYLHEKLFMCHRDLHMESFAINTNNDLVLHDLGTAKIFGEDGFEDDNQPRYFAPLFCAPEQLNHSKYSFNADTWMMGILFS